MTRPWFGLYLPQLRMGFDRILERAQAAEAAGFDSLWLMDHFVAPLSPDVDTFEGWTIATALAANTTRLRIGHLVLCDPFRHPVVTAKTAATFDVVSNGRLELGIGWGSVPDELRMFGFGPEPARVRVAKLRETLEILQLMFAGEPFDYDGEHCTLRRAIGRPAPVQAKVPIHIGGGGPKLTMPLVARLRGLVELSGLRARSHRRAAPTRRRGADLCAAPDRARGGQRRPRRRP